MKLLFASDLHGDESLFEELISYSIALEPDWLLLGGDILPKHTNNDDLISVQRQFLKARFNQFIENLKQKSPKTRVVAILGNDDCGVLVKELENMVNHGLLQTVHNKLISLESGWSLFGFHMVPETPFKLKDHERLDLNNSRIKFPGMGTSSKIDKLLPVNNEVWFNSHNSIEDELKKICFEGVDTQQLIFITHAPPWGMSLDQMANNQHVGSKAIRTFIEHYQPKITFHGHIHESFYESRQYWTHLGSTMCFNPGQIHQPSLDAVLVEIYDDFSKIIHQHLGLKNKPSPIGLKRLEAPLSK